MTSEVLTGPEPTRQQISTDSISDSIGERLGSLERTVRPREGWIAGALLVLNLVVVALSVEQANWAPSPNLVLLLFLAMLTGLILYRIPLWSAILLPAGFAVGLALILWQLSNFTIDGVSVGGTGQVLERLELWLDAARSGSINIDGLPFSFALMTATWLTGFLGAWLFLRFGNFWGVFVLGGIGLLSNLTFLPPNAAFHLGFYLFTALLLVARVQAIRRKHEWERRGVRVDDHLTGLTLSDSFALTVIVILTAFLLPVAPKLGVANDAYESMRSPLQTLEDDFNRLFAGLPARRPMGFRIWDNVLALQGSIYPTTTQVLWVDSPAEMYWKARTYSTYNGKGWLSENTVTEPLGYLPEFSQGPIERLRTNVTYKVTPLYASKQLFSGDQVLDVDRDVMIETQAQPVFTIDMAGLQRGQIPPEYLREVSEELVRAVVEDGITVDDGTLARSLPPQFRLDKVEREQGRVSLVQITEALPPVPEVLSVSSPKGKFRTGNPYQITSSISLATPSELREAGSVYPAWVSARYTQLPADLPQRVRDLAARVAGEEETPYDKAKSVEEFLKTSFGYNLRVNPPPFNADGVDHFLFTLKEGYSEYFGSTMAVMLRTLGVPARLAVGYTTGTPVGDEQIYAVTDSHNHAWVEVFFPGLGWIPFEPTPGETLPDAYQPEAAFRSVPPAAIAEIDPLNDECFNEVDDCLDPEAPGPDVVGRFGRGGGSALIGLWPWVLGVVAGSAVVGGAARWFWRGFMAPPRDPRTAFLRISSMASLAASGPTEFQTPYQFGQQLQQVFPDQEKPVSIIVSSYVRNRYGNKTPTASERRLLAVAWRRLRMPMLWAVFRRGV